MLKSLVESRKKHLFGALWGMVVGESVGLPVRGQPVEYRHIYPIETITGWGTYDLPPGYWNDKTAILLAILSGLQQKEYSIMNELKACFIHGEYTCEGVLYEYTQSFQNGIENFASELENDLTMINEEVDNGSDKIGFAWLPLSHFIVNRGVSISHQTIDRLLGHFHSTPVFRLCTYTVAYASYYLMVKGLTSEFLPSVKQYIQKFEKEKNLKKIIPMLGEELDRIPGRKLSEYPSEESYLHVLTLALYITYHAQSYEEAVLAAVNHGGPTDTQAALAGMLAGMRFGISGIPQDWLKYIQKKEQIKGIFDSYLAALAEGAIYIS